MLSWLQVKRHIKKIHCFIMDNNPANMAKYIPTLYFNFKASYLYFQVSMTCSNGSRLPTRTWIVKDAFTINLSRMVSRVHLPLLGNRVGSIGCVVFILPGFSLILLAIQHGIFFYFTTFINHSAFWCQVWGNSNSKIQVDFFSPGQSKKLNKHHNSRSWFFGSIFFKSVVYIVHRIMTSLSSNRIQLILFF